MRILMLAILTLTGCTMNLNDIDSARDVKIEEKTLPKTDVKADATIPLT